MAITAGLPAMGSDIGGAMKGVAPGAGAMILIPGIASSVARIPGYIAKGIEKRAGVPKRKPRRKQVRKRITRRPRKKPLTTIHKTPRYNTPLIPKLNPPKMGPY